jgi:hypothetical protein
MKKILLFIAILFSISSYGQNRFPSIDSAKNYTLRYVKNSAVESFTNLRMQNVTYGTLQLLDSLAGAGVIDTIFISTGDTLKYKIGSTTFVVGKVGGAGGTYTAANGLTLSGSEFRLGGTLSVNTQIISPFLNDFTLTTRGSSGDNNRSDLLMQNGSLFAYGYSGGSANRTISFSPSILQMATDASSAYLGAPNIYFQSGFSSGAAYAQTTTDTTTFKPLVLNTSTGLVSRMTSWPTIGGSTPNLQAVTDVGNTTTNPIYFNDSVSSNDNAVIGIDNSNGYLQIYNQSQSTSLGLGFENDSAKIQLNSTILKTRTLNSQSIYFPNKSGTLPLVFKINNGAAIAANDTGLVDLGTIGGTVTSASGTGTSLVNGSSQIKRLKAGTGISISDGTDSVTITNTAASVDSGRITQRPVSPTFGQLYYQTDELVGFYRYNGTAWVFQKPYETLIDFWFPAKAYNVATGAGLAASGGGDYRIGSSLTNMYNNFKFYTAAAAAVSGFDWGVTGFPSNQPFTSTDSNFVFNTRIYLLHLSDATDTYTFRFGSNSGTTSDGIGAYFKYTHGTNGGQWQCITQNSIGTNTINTSSAPATNTPYQLTIVKYGISKVEFFINGTLVATSTSNITSSIHNTGAWLARSAGTGERSFHADRLLIYRF